MDVSALTSISSDYWSELSKNGLFTEKKDDSFSSILASAMNMISETNELQNKAESEEIRFALGEAENTHDLLIAEIKALTALQYTTAVRDKALEAYKEIMNMQI